VSACSDHFGTSALSASMVTTAFASAITILGPISGRL
jgi:hypothetical protein